MSGGHTWIANDERRADAFFVGVPFVGEPVFRMEVTVVSCEYDEGVIQGALPSQLFDHAATGGVYLGAKTVVVFHHRLVFLRRIEAPVIADAAFILLIRDEGRKPMKIFVGRSLGHWNDRVLIQRHTGGLREVLLGILVFGVRCEKRERETKRFIRRTSAQEIERIVLILLGNVDQ